MRLSVVIVTTLGLAVLLLAPATAASKPARVGLVTFTEASLNVAKGTASLTVDWPDARGARKYQIFVSRSYSMAKAQTFTSSTSRKKITGLARGVDYFVQVRGVNGSAVGSKSKRSGHSTIRDQSRTPGPTYRVMTYNVCSDKCSGWESGRSAAAAARVRSFSPDVIALQEAKKAAFTPADLAGYTQVAYASAKHLYVRTARFAVAASGSVQLSPGRFAVWGETIDHQADGRRVFFVSAHLTPGKSDKAARLRQAETKVLIDAMRAVNPANHPVVYAGDFNSHKNRGNDYVAPVFQAAGLYDAFDLAETLTRQHHNSYSGLGPKPAIGITWGDHVDHVWVDPTTTRVTSWTNGVHVRSGRIVTPVPSDHSPIVVDLQLG